MIKVRRAAERGHANHGWLDSYHTFSFADYRDPRFDNFRSLRVLNEDRVAGGGGFGTHSHRDFEIISYIVRGALKHQDSMSHQAVMKAGDVQRISAGSGISHSEFNDSSTDEVHFLQIWLTPNQSGLAPNYAQRSFAAESASPLILACSKDGRSNSIKINQNAEMYIGHFIAGQETTQALDQSRYAWLQLIEGNLAANKQLLEPGDGAAIEMESSLQLTSKTGAHFLLFNLD